MTDEYTKTAKHNDRGAGISTSVMALVSTNLKITSDVFQAIADFLGPKYDESKKKGADYARQAQDTASQYKQIGQDKVGDLAKLGQQKAGEYQKYGEEKADQAKGKAEEKKEEAKKQTQAK